MKNTSTPVRLAFTFLALGAFHGVGLAADTPAKGSEGASSAASAHREHTPLHLAALRGDADAVDALLARGADANALNQFGATPLHYGVGNERIVAALLAHGAKPNLMSDAGLTPIFGAVSRNDSFAVVRRLVEAGADVNLTRNLPGERGSGLLGIAILGGDRRTLTLLLDPKTHLAPRQFTLALSAAALVGDLETTRVLLERGGDPNAPANQTGSALNTALRGGNNAVAKLLIEHGADLHAKSPLGYGTTPLVFSAYNDSGDPSLAKLLLDRGVPIDTATDVGETALSYALKQGPDTELVRFLLARGAKPPSTPVPAKQVPNREVPAESAARVAMTRESAQRSIDLLQRSSTAFLESGFVRNQGKCISCHQQALPAVAYGLARERGLRVDEKEIGRQLVAKVAMRQTQIGLALELVTPTGGPALSIGHEAEELHALHFAPNEFTGALSHYLIGVQRTDGSWSSPIRRVPMNDGAVSGTAWALRAVQLYPPAERTADAEASVRRARDWLRQQKPATPNERVFQLLGLAWANETPEHLQPFVEGIVRDQRSDGGWSQLSTLTSDAWATGSALHALHQAGLAASHPVYRRGVDFLLRTQYDDGSWWVKTRSWPFQPHFDSAFPHGRDQWISAAATAWATIALLATLEPTVPAASLPNGEQLIAAFTKAAANPPQRASAAMATTPVSSGAVVDFARDIQPLFERSCAGCHSGERPKGGFTITTREALLKGGNNNEPPLIPGLAEKSLLLRYVSDQVEDLEMPPLARREKYPALSREEVDRVRAWIDAGAPWPAKTVSASEKISAATALPELAATPVAH